MKRIVSILIVLCLVFSFSASAAADSELQHNYSTVSNSGIRHETCTTLLGTSVDSYYTGSYTYENLSSQSGTTLLNSLRTLMTNTHTRTTSYSDCKNKARYTDCEGNDTGHLTLLYTSFSATQAQFASDGSHGWNREHVWPQSLSDCGTTGAGSDLHHVRPDDAATNSGRSNLKYGNVNGGYTVYGYLTGDIVGGSTDGSRWQNSTYFEPVDNVKGDVARIVLYMYVRYGGDSRYNCSSVTGVFQSVNVLLEWCALDPVDTWEMGRNEVIAAIQGNRNVFIDYPELAWALFGREVPANLTTPSQGSNNDFSTACTHSNTVVYKASDSTCTAEGYTGDIYCADCNALLEAGKVIAMLEHITATVNVSDGNCGKDGYTGDIVCTVCNATLTQGQVIPATGEHSYGDWTVMKNATAKRDGYRERICSICGNSETQVIPAYGDSSDTSGSDDRNNESDGDRNTANSGGSQSGNVDDGRTNESDGDRSTVSSGKTESTQPTTEATEPATEATEPVTQPETTAPAETTEATQPTESTAATQPSTQAPTTEPEASTEMTQPAEEDPASNNNIWIVICGNVLAACAAGIVLYFNAEKRKHKKHRHHRE